MCHTHMESAVNNTVTRKIGTKTILVIEDETEIQNFVSRVLELEGYQVLKAGDGESGMEIMRENPVSLVLLDLRLPGRDGWSVLQEIRNDSELAKVPVVVLTAVADALQRRRTLNMGATKYLVKPMSAHDLASAIAGTLHQRSQRPNTLWKSSRTKF
jgi:DNA-binding response OmpR family regulator